MKTKNYFFSREDKPVFTDSHDQRKLFTIEFEEWKRQNRIIEEYIGVDCPIPHDITISAYSIKRVDGKIDVFEILSDDEIRFPLHRVIWMK